MKLYFLIFALGLLLPWVGYAQNVEMIWSPEFSYTWSDKGRWTFNGKINPRAFIYHNQTETYLPDRLMERWEFQLLANYALFINSTVGGGYILGLRTLPDTSVFNIEHRALLQYGFSFYIGSARIGNRIRPEYRYFTLDDNEFRLRYKLSYDIPLNGREIDAGENYLVVSNEFLGAAANKEFSMENRIYAGIGWQMRNKRKLEAGIEYRADDYFNETEHALLLVTSFYLNKN